MTEMQSIQTKEDFLSFLRFLKKDYLENAQSWENREISTFLAAVTSWVEDMDGFYTNQELPVPEGPDWKIFADIPGGKL